jgi:hypothetical protein
MSAYDRPFKYLKKHGAYLVTLRRPTRSQSGLYDVVPDGGDRAVPRGYIENPPGLYLAYHYHPAHAADVSGGDPIAGFTTLGEAVEAVLHTPVRGRFPLGYMQGRGAS